MAETQLKIAQLKNSPSLTNELAESLRTQIIDGNMKPGTKLPAAKEIEQQAGVSRSVVREAVAALKAEGLIISRQGVGIFVCDIAHKKSFEIDQEEFNSIESAIKILELRMAVEVEMSAMAASNRNKRQMTKINKCLANFSKQIVAGKDAVKEDLAFHLAIADAAGNAYFSRFINYIGLGVIPSRELILQDYRNMVQAIENKDKEAAKDATKEHFVNCRIRHLEIISSLKKSA